MTFVPDFYTDNFNLFFKDKPIIFGQRNFNSMFRARIYEISLCSWHQSQPFPEVYILCIINIYNFSNVHHTSAFK